MVRPGAPTGNQSHESGPRRTSTGHDDGGCTQPGRARHPAPSSATAPRRPTTWATASMARQQHGRGSRGFGAGGPGPPSAGQRRDPPDERQRVPALPVATAGPPTSPHQDERHRQARMVATTSAVPFRSRARRKARRAATPGGAGPGRDPERGRLVAVGEGADAAQHPDREPDRPVQLSPPGRCRPPRPEQVVGPAPHSAATRPPRPRRLSASRRPGPGGGRRPTTAATRHQRQQPTMRTAQSGPRVAG